MIRDLLPMGCIPRDGTEVIVKSKRCDVFLRVGWTDSGWMSGTVPVAGEFSGWTPIPSARGSARLGSARPAEPPVGCPTNMRV